MGIECVLIVNKADLAEKRGGVEGIDRFARINGFAAWFRTSALENTGLQEVLRYLIKEG